MNKRRFDLSDFVQNNTALLAMAVLLPDGMTVARETIAFFTKHFDAE